MRRRQCPSERLGAKTHLELLRCFLNPVSVLTVHHVNEAICVVEVMSPQWSQLFLPAHIPDCEEDILVLHLLNIETCREYVKVSGRA